MLEEKGSYIDSFDAVVRMNNYTFHDHINKYTGTKTDIYAFTFHKACEWKNRLAGWNICVVDPTGLKSHSYKSVKNLTLFTDTEKEWFDKFGAQPTTGARILSFFSQFTFDKMYVTGFSYGNKDYNRYYETDNKKDQIGHNLDLELEWLKKNKKHYMEFDEHITHKLNQNV